MSWSLSMLCGASSGDTWIASWKLASDRWCAKNYHLGSYGSVAM